MRPRKQQKYSKMCSPDNQPAIAIEAVAYESLRSLALSSKSTETGGILVGFHEGSDIRISNVSGPGDNASRSEVHVVRDTQHCKQFLQVEYSNSGADYVGEWHSHVIGAESLSSGDLHTVARIMTDPDYDFPSFAILLAIVDGVGCEFRSFVAFFKNKDLSSLHIHEVQLKILEDNRRNEDSK